MTKTQKTVGESTYRIKISILTVAVVTNVLLAGHVRAQSASFESEPRQRVIIENSDAGDYIGIFRRPKQTDSALIEQISQLGAVETVRFPPGTSLIAFIVKKCGIFSPIEFVHPSYRNAVLSMNPSLKDSEWTKFDGPATLSIPACARFSTEEQVVATPRGIEAAAKIAGIPFSTHVFRDVWNDTSIRTMLQASSSWRNPIKGEFPVAAPAGSTVDRAQNDLTAAINTTCGSMYGTLAGAPALQSYTACLNALSVVARNPELRDPDRGIQKITILASTTPGDSQEERVPLKANIDTRSTLGNSIEPRLSIVTPVSDQSQLDISCITSRTEKGDNWPIDWKSLYRVVGYSDGWRTQASGVLVIDSGFDFAPPPTGKDHRSSTVQHAFPAAYFHRTPIEEDSPEEPEPIDRNADGIDRNGGEGVVNLVTLTGSRGAGSPPEYTNRTHGLSVSTLALGGLGAEGLRLYAPVPVRLGVASIVNPNEIHPVITADAITNSLRYASGRGNKIDIINLSLTASRAISSLDLQIQEKAYGKLIVAAAGNDGKEIGREIDAYPAAWGGAIRGATADTDAHRRGMVLTVGAHNGAGHWAKFSNYGQSVDILAPGCMIPTYTLKTNRSGDPIGIQTTEVSGTSFAAPVVSFVAALLASQPRATPGWVKLRIQISGDFRFNLSDRVFSSSILNPAKAYGGKFDIVEKMKQPNNNNGDQFLMGYLQETSSMKDNELPCNFSRIRFGDIRKIARSTDNDATLVFHMTNPHDPATLKREFCQREFGKTLDLKFTDIETEETTNIPIVELKEFISRDAH